MRKIDLFISYKSDEVNEVRPVAEALISQGLDVWFAEYDILLLDYNQHKPVLLEGLCSAAFGICFTSNKWAGSDHCCEEFDILSKRLAADRILEIGRPGDLLPHKKRPKLKDSPFQEWTRDIGEMVDFIAAQSSLAIHKDQIFVPSSSPNWTSWINRTQFTKFRLDIGPFGSKPEFLHGDSYNDALFRGTVEKVPVRLGVFTSSTRTAIGKLAAEGKVAQDDRQLAAMYRKYASDAFIGGAVAESRSDKGLHLFFKDGKGQVALTYSYPTDAGFMWERRYVITTERSAARPSATRGYMEMMAEDSARILGEIDIVFGCEMPHISDQEALRAFCRLTPTFDKIVDSLEWKPITLMGETYEDNYQRDTLHHRILPVSLRLIETARVEDVSENEIRVVFKGSCRLVQVSVENRPEHGVNVPLGWTIIGSVPLKEGGELVFAESDLSPLNKRVRGMIPTFGQFVIGMFCSIVALVVLGWTVGKAAAISTGLILFSLVSLLLMLGGSQKLRYSFVEGHDQCNLVTDFHMCQTLNEMTRDLLPEDVDPPNIFDLKRNRRSHHNE
ncbi:MAG: toll/interleukin-1 receptor domain-containing protein [Planctomycetaceae bacterium]|nr:toll/interleukin-1 receptor domain-containing protein [Planctomycetaceae bacterium]